MSLWIEHLRQERGWRVFAQRGEVTASCTKGPRRRTGAADLARVAVWDAWCCRLMWQQMVESMQSASR